MFSAGISIPPLLDKGDHSPSSLHVDITQGRTAEDPVRFDWIGQDPETSSPLSKQRFSYRINQHHGSIEVYGSC